jgi:antitoxin VapB
MALNIKNREVERLAKEVAEMARETKTQAIRIALEDRKAKLAAEAPRARLRGKDLRDWLEKNIWSTLPPDLRGKGISKEEREEILGYGPDGY